MTKEKQVDSTFKVVFAGDAGTGKTSWLNRLTKQTFDAATKSTSGIAYSTHEMKSKDSVVIYRIWDLAGGLEYRAMVRCACHDALGVFLVYDITNRTSFKNCIEWIKEINYSSDLKLKVMLIGNKSDLVKSRAVSTEEAQIFATENDLVFMETSALNGDHVESTFQQMAIEALSDNDCQGTPFQVVLIDRKTAAKGKIHCVEKSLQGDLKFVALSYRWGELQESMVDTDLGYIATITSFRLKELYHLCGIMEYDPDLKQMEYVWVDAICVDQANYERRKATIYHMSEIYEHANHILAVPDLHLQHLKDAYSETQNIIQYYDDYKDYLYYLFHGSYERLYELDESFLDKIGIPKHPDIRQWLTNETGVLTKGFTEYEIHTKDYNPIDVLEHVCEVICDVYQAPTTGADDLDKDTVDNKVGALLDIDYNVHYCNKTECPLDECYYNMKPQWQKTKYPENVDSRPQTNGWCRMILDRSTRIRQVIRRLMDLLMDWSTRAWVISELSIARKKNYLKYWFLHLPMDWIFVNDIVREPGFSFYNFNFDNPAVKYTEICNSPLIQGRAPRISDAVCQAFHNLMIIQLNEQTFLEKMLKSKASRHEDRYYAVLPSSPYKCILENRDVVSSWNIQSMVSVKLKLYEWMTTKDKSSLFFLSGGRRYGDLHPISPTFATSTIYWDDDFSKYPVVVNNCNFDLDSSDAIQLVPPVDNGCASKYCLSVMPKTYYQVVDVKDYLTEEYPDYKLVCKRLQIDDRNDISIAFIPPGDYVPRDALRWSECSSVFVFLIGSMTENKWEIHRWRRGPLDLPTFIAHDTGSSVRFNIY